MIKSVIFDMYETLITQWYSYPYAGTLIAADAGIDEGRFRPVWDSSDDDRTLGKRTFEDVIEEILRANNRYSRELFEMIVAKRKKFKEENFDHLDIDIIPMMEGLRSRGIRIGLITNCYNEEAEIIKNSILYKYFDIVCMSCMEGIKKPDRRIFKLCIDRLGLNAEECLFCGDGGSNELEVARLIGMKPVQAVWYLKEGSGQPVGRLPQYEGANNPMEIIEMIDQSGYYKEIRSIQNKYATFS